VLLVVSGADGWRRLRGTRLTARQATTLPAQLKRIRCPDRPASPMGREAGSPAGSHQSSNQAPLSKFCTGGHDGRPRMAFNDQSSKTKARSGLNA
jgi:hypothetical protein